MAGIYIHIPFCRQACHYCNFHFSTSQSMRGEMVRAICREIEIKQDFFQGRPKISTVYFGGGTPSVLNTGEISAILDALSGTWDVDAGAEITLEANPDDLSPEKLRELRSAGISRLSIGIQSFDDALLAYMNRAHNSEEAVRCLEESLGAGFKDISADLIYGIPGLTEQQWERQLLYISSLPIDHLSCYALTVEPSTALHHFIRKKNWPAPDEGVAAAHFLRASSILEDSGFTHYEISNFARRHKFSGHNTSYWKGEDYLGLGPSAHSFRGKERSWNIANNAAYVKAIGGGSPFTEYEVLSDDDRYNEYIMTGLRTMWGIDRDRVMREFGPERHDEIMRQLQAMDADHYTQTGDTIRLTTAGWLFSDGICASLFV